MHFTDGSMKEIIAPEFGTECENLIEHFEKALAKSIGKCFSCSLETLAYNFRYVG